MLFKNITIALDMSGCPNRCKHCWIGHFKNGNMSIEDLKYVANSFKDYTNSLEVYSWFREPDFNVDYKKLWEIDNELSKNTKPKRFELLSFWRINRDEEYVKWAYNIGVRRCQLTFFGLEEKTDYYVGRKGAFNELINATRILLENKIAPRWQIFVNKDNINEIEKLIDLSKEMNLEERCKEFGEEFELFIHQGSCDGENEKLYDIRITSDDLVNIPKEFHHRLGKREKDLYGELINDSSTKNLVTDFPVFYITSQFDVYPNYTSIAPWWYLGNIKRDGVKKVLDNYINNRSLGQKSSLEVPIKEMVKVCGDQNSNRLFDRDDYIIYIINKYCRNNIKFL
ncbi:radical SAM protein [Clostridium perfringens]|nr:radical SAM protein [Clostridium perfringens]